MSKINIMGVSALTILGSDADEVFNKLLGDLPLNPKYESELDIPLIINKNKLRRMDRFSYMGLYAVNQILENAKDELCNVPKERIGTIFSTAYGPQKTNIEFCKQVIQDDPDICSPTLFSNTVSNACLGHICMKYKLTGVSTMLMASNSIGFSIMLMEENKADYIISGNIEEYSDEINTSFHELNSLKYKLGECTAVLLLKRENDMSKTSEYGEIKNFAECSLGTNPFISELSAENIKTKISKTIKRSLSVLGKDETVDAVICSGDPEYIDTYEENTMKLVNSNCKIIKNVKNIFGETLGSSLELNLILASLCLKNDIIPKKLTENETDSKNINNILVCGYDVSGNYAAILIGR